jgi:hypothetical protein
MASPQAQYPQAPDAPGPPRPPGPSGMVPALVVTLAEGGAGPAALAQLRRSGATVFFPAEWQAPRS